MHVQWNFQLTLLSKLLSLHCKCAESLENFIKLIWLNFYVNSYSLTSIRLLGTFRLEEKSHKFRLTNISPRLMVWNDEFRFKLLLPHLLAHFSLLCKES